MKIESIGADSFSKKEGFSDHYVTEVLATKPL